MESMEAYNAGFEAGKNHSEPSRETSERLIKLETAMENIPNLIKIAINEAMQGWFEKIDTTYMKKEYEEHIDKLEDRVDDLQTKMNKTIGIALAASIFLPIILSFLLDKLM